MTLKLGHTRLPQATKIKARFHNLEIGQPE